MKYLSIDWGLKNLGFATSEGTLASPLKEVKVNSLNQAMDIVTQLIKSEQIEIIVIGKPESGEALRAVEKAVLELKKLNLEVIEVEETLTSKRTKTHKEAAALILQECLDSI